MKVTNTTWLVYGMFNGDPIAQFFNNSEDAWGFVGILRMYPNASGNGCLAVNEVRGIDYEAAEFIHHEGNCNNIVTLS